jgi:hypothetical protein
LEARRDWGAEKGPTMDRVRQNRCEKDRQNCKNKKTHKTSINEQYKEILKQIMENPAKTKYKGKSKQMKQNTGKPKKI